MKKNSIFKALSVAAIAGAMVIAPTAANAYAPTPNPDNTVTVEAGATVTITIEAGSFIPGEDVEIVVSGVAGADIVLASAADVSSTSITKTADAEGGLAVDVTLPSNAEGTYELVATGLESGNVVTGTIVVSAAGGGEGDDDGSLAPTGADAAGLGLWIGGGALLLGGGAVLVARSVRKQGSQA